MVIKDKDMHKKNPFLLKACSAFFKRIVHQVKQVWIFFQLETLKVFHDFLEQNGCTNKLMANVNISRKTKSDVQLNYNVAELKAVVKTITLRFVQLLKKNKMLAVEILFEFPTREIKDSVLNNYGQGDGEQSKAKQIARPEADDDEAPIDLDNFGENGGNNSVEEE